MNPVKRLNRMMLLAATPFLGMLLWLFFSSATIELSEAAFPAVQPAAADGAAGQQSAGESEPPAAAATAKQLQDSLDQAAVTAQQTSKSIQKQIHLYNQTNADVNQMVSIAAAQAERPLQIYDNNITVKLGKPAATINSSKLKAQLFYIHAQNFEGYALKVKLKSDKAMTMALGNDQNGGAETTLHAVKRTGAAIGVNAGGFADGGGKRYPLSTTIVNGKYVNGFEASYTDLFFAGINEDNELVGGNYSSKEQLDAEHIRFGASFVPILLKHGQPQSIPVKWQTSPARAPRTVLANYKDDQLLFLVVDGYNENGSSGATLSEMQILLQRYGAVDGYNLDGAAPRPLFLTAKSSITHRTADSCAKSPLTFCSLNKSGALCASITQERFFFFTLLVETLSLLCQPFMRPIVFLSWPKNRKKND
ncbi:phosphodiester glycosidase family protein [Paenibacillus protaetiae]|uniref:phosphodiester glycosidase family protein n=1 Tax=Paenibacillus protaetiae TaxID=2509456 RepID=UPI0026BFD084